MTAVWTAGSRGVSRAERTALVRRVGFPSKAALCLGFLALTLIFTDLGETSLPSFDDAYHAQTAKEMLVRGDPITITYGGSPSFQSSPLPLWFTSAAYLVSGVNEFAARLPSALLAFATIALVYFFTRRRWGEDAGVAAAFILLTTPLFLRYSRHAMAEVPLAFFSTAALILLVTSRERRSNYAFFGLVVGLAILTKSALGLLPLVIVAIFFLVNGRKRELASPAFIIALLLSAAVAAAWYLPAWFTNGQFFIDSHFGAFLGNHLTSGSHADLGLWGYAFYLLWIPLQYLPWTLLLLPALAWGVADRWNEEGAPMLMWLAVVVPIVALTFVSSKYTRYLMPIFPAAAILIAATWSKRLPTRWKRISRSVIGWLSIAAVAVIIVFPLSLGDDRNADVKAIAPAVRGISQPDMPIANLGLDFYGYQNPLLFYADRLLGHPLEGPEGLWNGLQPGGQRSALATVEDFEAALQAVPIGVELHEEARSGELVLFRVGMPGKEVWAEEVGQLAPLIIALETPEHLGCYKLPKKPLGQVVRDATGRRMMIFDTKPRQLVRAMERRGTTYGLASTAAFHELESLPRELPRVIRLAATERLILFRLETVASSTER